MKPLLGEEGQAALSRLTQARTLYAFDYDGTLAPIRSIPTEALIPHRLAVLLRQFSEQYPVAVISGRSVADLKQRLPFLPRYLVGNHGHEASIDVAKYIEEGEVAKAQIKAWAEQVTSGLSQIPGVSLENKHFSLTLHYRGLKNRAHTKLRLLGLAEELEPKPRIVLGKSVINLVLPHAPHKGTALLELMRDSESTHALYAGDDDTDEDVFAIARPEILTVRIGHKRKSRAQYFVEKVTDISQVLNLLMQPKT